MIFGMGGILCPDCGAETCVADSRGRDGYVWRRRKCLACGRLVTTDERISGTRLRGDELLDALETFVCEVGLSQMLVERLAQRADLTNLCG